MPDSFFIKAGYRAREEPEYANELDMDGVVWQPDVYPEAARLAEFLGASCIVDVGSGDGAKLAALHPRFAAIGIDLPGPNLDHSRARFPDVDWIEYDVESNVALPVPDVVLTGSIVVCSDVIEHLRHPDRLLRTLRSALDVAPAVVLSTPERDLTWGREHFGPPPNPSHAREWTIDELSAFLDSLGLTNRLTSLTRSNDRHNQEKTILCRLFRDEAAVSPASLTAP